MALVAGGDEDVGRKKKGVGTSLKKLLVDKVVSADEAKSNWDYEQRKRRKKLYCCYELGCFRRSAKRSRCLWLLTRRSEEVIRSAVSRQPDRRVIIRLQLDYLASKFDRRGRDQWQARSTTAASIPGRVPSPSAATDLWQQAQWQPG